MNRVIFGMALFTGGIGAAHADAVSNAYGVCAAMESTGLITRCDVKGWGKSVDMRMDTSSSEARKICSGVADMLGKKGPSLRANKWKLRIFSPYSGDEPIAVCNF